MEKIVLPLIPVSYFIFIQISQQQFFFTINFLGTIKGGHKVPVLHSKEPGETYGLRLHLHTDSGIDVYINNRSTKPNINQNIIVSTGMRTNLIVKRIFELDLKAPYSDCKEFLELTPPNGTKTIFGYNQAECFQLCQYKAIFDACGMSNEYYEHSHDYYDNIYQFLTIYYFVRNTCNWRVRYEVERRFKREGKLDFNFVINEMNYKI